jgi:hypothetical protein
MWRALRIEWVGMRTRQRSAKDHCAKIGKLTNFAATSAVQNKKGGRNHPA